jgi:hypothetical protein
MLVLGMGLLAALLLRRTYRRLGRRRRKEEPAIARVPRPKANPRELMDAPADIAQYEVRLHETARELCAILDSKMAALNALTQQAQAKIDRLEAMLGQNEADAPETPPPAAPAPAAYEGEHAELHRLADEGFSAATISHRTHRPLAEVRALLAERETGGRSSR